MQCTYCSADLEPGSQQCPYCGTPVRSLNEQAPVDTTSPFTQPSQPIANAALPPQPVTEPATRRFRGPRLALVLLLLAIVLLLAEAGGIGYYASVYHPAALNANATAAAQSAVTASYNNPGMLYKLVTAQPPTVIEPLNDADNSIWDSNPGDTTSSCGVKTGIYHVIVNQQGYIMRCGLASVFDNFAFQVQMSIISGDNGGVLFRYDPDNNQYYRLQITPSGAYKIYAYDQGQGVHDLQSGQIHTFNKGIKQTNLVMVIAQGNKFSVYINKSFVTSVHDNSYPEGTLALSAADATNPTDVTFSNAQIWILS